MAIGSAPVPSRRGCPAPLARRRLSLGATPPSRAGDARPPPVDARSAELKNPSRACRPAGGRARSGQREGRCQLKGRRGRDKSAREPAAAPPKEKRRSGDGQAREGRGGEGAAEGVRRAASCSLVDIMTLHSDPEGERNLISGGKGGWMEIAAELKAI